MGKVPVCSRCGQPHYNFNGCDESAEQRLVEAAAARLRTNRDRPVFRPRATDVADRSANLVRISNVPGQPQVIGLRRPPLHSVTDPRRAA